MKEILLFLVFPAILLLLELIYFRVAKKLDIVDHPNHRSSHQAVTIRGGGIIFSLAILLYAVLFRSVEPWFLIGLTIISTISFLDDIKPRDYKLRMLIHLSAVVLLFFQTGIFNYSIPLILLSFFFVVGTINAINFMDGINGITGMYGILTLGTLLYYNTNVERYTDSGYLIAGIIAVTIFLIFNFRQRAVCFAGDIGSISLAYIVLFFILRLIILTNSCSYVLFLLVYGLDVVTTIVFRIIRREKLSEAHRSHFYQYLVNERQMSHLQVTIIYSIVQLFINIFVINYRISVISDSVLIIMTTGILFVIIRFIFEGSARLLTGSRNN